MMDAEGLIDLIECGIPCGFLLTQTPSFHIVGAPK